MRPKREELCPICNKKGTGLYPRYVLNGRKVRYEPYFYFRHVIDGKVKWCYVPHALVENKDALIKKWNEKEKKKQSMKEKKNEV
jgi:hypothetical protein